jgi:hypothetical protein
LHPPQSSFVISARSQPSAASRLQSPNLPTQLITLHWPSPHSINAWSLVGQVLPQPPQSERLFSAVSQPLSSSPSQSAKPSSQAASAQRPSSQLAEAWLKRQAAPHNPQFSGEASVVSQPLASF